ncbi:MAG: AmmeMemoRadiSam system protein B [Acidilobaceae archaeon]|nr:AmmeMemoRadiSam system protein B [Acidilobaceae archaeon]MCX8165812.1 AmmeMemoRadiSam system protein B [Acidilobaceae archaeon]MDW7974236.1 AmmeMemoRadiSam system protein B [Sulfolobales archaeon]
MIRHPYHAGSFYPERRDELLSAIRASFLHPLGPGQLPSGPGGQRLSYAYLVPHAGYMYSGPIAAHAYYHLSRERVPETVILVGPNHTGLGLAVSVYPRGSWRTPLGDVEVDEEAAKLISTFSGIAAPDMKAHIYEHSLEVQLPFLQFVLGEKFKIVPITVMAQVPSISRALAEAAMRVREEVGIDSVVVATSDLNHYEPHDVAVKKDSLILEAFLKPDPEGVFKAAEEYGVSACGPGPMAMVAYIARAAGTKPLLLSHATSGDVTGEKDWVVGYASVKVPRS